MRRTSLALLIAILPQSAVAAEFCAAIEAQLERGASPQYASRQVDGQMTRAFAEQTGSSAYLVWPEEQEVRVNLDAPVIVIDGNGAECESPAPGGYAKVIALVIKGVTASKLDVPVCDLATQLCDYVTISLSRETH